MPVSLSFRFLHSYLFIYFLVFAFRFLYSHDTVGYIFLHEERFTFYFSCPVRAVDFWFFILVFGKRFGLLLEIVPSLGFICVFHSLFVETWRQTGYQIF